MSYLIATANEVDPDGIGALIGTALVWAGLALLGLWIHNRSYKPKRTPYPRNRKHHSQ